MKRVGRAKLDEIARLASSEDLAQRWARVRRWLEDDDAYAKVRTSTAAPKTRLSKKDVEKLVEFGIVEEIPAESVRGGVRMFTVPEAAKSRRRPIKHTADVNEAYGKDSLEGLKLPTKAEIVNVVHSGSHMAAFDYSAYFDQFEYSEKIQNRLCFAHNGRTYRLRVLGMGQRHATDIASTATDVIDDFDHRSAAQLKIIDNILYVGSKRQCRADGLAFFHRSSTAGLTINDVWDKNGVEAAISTEGDWCGIHLNFTDKTVCLAKKSVDKTRVSWENKQNWTYRNFAAHVGLLFWAVGILDIPLASFYDLLHFVAEVGRRTQARPELWDEKIQMWNCAIPSLTAWTQMVLANRPRLVPKQEEPTLFVATDASAWGWGFVAFDSVTGCAHHHGEAWSPSFLNRVGPDSVKSSVFAEPHAIVNAMCRLLTRDRPCTVFIGTDNTAAEASFRRGWNARSFNLNLCVWRLHRLFPNHQFQLTHIAGASNPADKPSRGEEPNPEDVEGGRLRRILGVRNHPPRSLSPPNVLA